MRKITRALTAATIAAAIGGGAIWINSGTAQAQPARMGAPQEAGQPMRVAHHGRGPGGGPGAMMGDPAEHLKRLKEEVGITDAQAAAWDAYAKVVADTAERMRAARPDGSHYRFLEMSTADRLAELTKMRDLREQGHAQVKAAADALLPTLTDTQKVRALMTLPGLAAPHMMMRKHAMGHHHRHGGPSSR